MPSYITSSHGTVIYEQLTLCASEDGPSWQSPPCWCSPVYRICIFSHAFACVPYSNQSSANERPQGGGLLFKEGTNLNAEFLSNTIISPPGPTPPFEQLVPLGHTW